MTVESPLIPEEDMRWMSERARAIYERKLKAVLEPAHNGEVVAIHLDTEDYEVAKTSPRAWKALRVRQPTGLMVILDIGPAKVDGVTLRMLGSQMLAGQLSMPGLRGHTGLERCRPSYRSSGA